VEGEFAFRAELWLWQNRRDSWTFVTLPEDLSDVIEEVHGERSRGFGSLRVEVAIDGHVWRTSIFPDRGRQAYVLPVKKDVRRKVGVDTGDSVEIELSVL
jgi:hypothetical protein